MVQRDGLVHALKVSDTKASIMSMKDFLTRSSYIPLNENGQEMTFEELDAYVKSFPILESPQNFEDSSTLIDEPLEEWAKKRLNLYSRFCFEKRY